MLSLLEDIRATLKSHGGSISATIGSGEVDHDPADRIAAITRRLELHEQALEQIAKAFDAHAQQ